MNNAEYETRGFYYPNFFSLYIDGEFYENFEDMSSKDLGTFVHEYIHYLQNITTVLGLRSSLLFFNYLYEVKKHIVENDRITLPIAIDHSKVISEGKARFSLYKGTDKIYSPEYDSYTISILNETANGIPNKKVCLILYLKEECIDTIFVGNNCVKESMARLYQSFFDEEVDHNTFPYKSAEMLCEVLNPELLKDKRKLIALCLLALNSQNCGYALYDLIIRTKDDDELTGVEIYKKYLSELFISTPSQKLTIQEFLLKSIVEFQHALSATLVSDMNFINQLLENIRLQAENNVLPLIEILYEDEIDNLNKLKFLKEFYGIPHIRTVSGFNFFPIDSTTGQYAIEYIDLIGQRIVLERILGIGKAENQCSLYPTCILDNVDLPDDNCFDKQWIREIPCPFKMVSDNWKLNEKIK